MERCILTTGGTGGHIFPALAVAEELRRRHPDLSILFVGGAHGPEGALAQRAGLDFAGLPVRGLMGRGLKALTAGGLMALGLAKAVGLVKRYRPQVVVGFGGYAAFAGVMAAVALRLPTALHEQNSVPGAANRLLGRFVQRVFVSFPDRRGDFEPARTRMTGNPVRADIRAVAAARKERQPGRNLLVLGGSQGAVAVNNAVIAALPELSRSGVSIRHQAGKRDADRVRAAYRAIGLAPDPEPANGGGMVRDFIDDMAGAYAWADLVVGRAGASTVFELAAAGLPSVLIPFPHATNGHQLLNARYLEERGGALVVEEGGLGADFARLLLDLVNDHKRLAAMGEAARALSPKREGGAAAVIADELEALA